MKLILLKCAGHLKLHCIKFPATQLHPNLKASDLNVQGEANDPLLGGIGLKICPTTIQKYIESIPCLMDVCWNVKYVLTWDFEMT